MKTCIRLKSVVLVLLFVWNINSQCSRNDVQTTSGPVRGTRVYFRGRTLKQYLGIPYAKPPVGQLRFKKPEPIERRNETYFADKMPPACIQYTEYPFPWYDFQDGKSEDCLYLNIWVPDGFLSGLNEKYSVMFWIYGGGFTFGSNRKKIYEGQVLAAIGDVIVVTVNYRLGVFGFLTSGTEEAPGNAAVYDMVEALKWVNQNIEAFGGDPEKVTLFGESAGSVAVGLLCVSPLTKGLFHRVIMQSSSAAKLLPENNTANIAKSQQLAKAVGCADNSTTIQSDPETVVDCLRGFGSVRGELVLSFPSLRAADIDILLSILSLGRDKPCSQNYLDVDAFVLAKTFSSFNPTSTRSFFPNYGDEVLPRNAREEIISGNFHSVDVLIGNNKDEGSFHITTKNPDLFGFFGEKNPRINKSYGETMIRKIFESFSFPDPEAVVQHYLGDLVEDDYGRIREQVYTSSGDYVTLCPSVYFAESYSKAGNDVRYYFFVHRPSTTPWAQWMGVAHYEDVQFVFGLPLREPQNYTMWEIMLSRKLIKIWTDFTKRGSSGWTNWPQYSKEDPTYIELDIGFMTRRGKGPHKDNCDFYRGYFGFD